VTKELWLRVIAGAAKQGLRWSPTVRAEDVVEKPGRSGPEVEPYVMEELCDSVYAIGLLLFRQVQLE
jgi:hypothetical protein